ncbi:hypothetical protein VCUG_00551 [Vavraia culicis subsp. floridensis]|uniref:Uncharacterized protein n=1 Tax=Vavraia culicis (isolate floridensis) TaxID=948595 RepID=L2GXG5_VAVCU|nr:uncharacterized protein VCUG_00551 [Vavraia culicis subsp. floridensis]ELA47968.1 hypothetical protein VCUG_00551 [Vavraia culicis subsp. floridensis]
MYSALGLCIARSVTVYGLYWQFLAVYTYFWYLHCLALPMSISLNMLFWDLSLSLAMIILHDPHRIIKPLTRIIIHLMISEAEQMSSKCLFKMSKHVNQAFNRKYLSIYR